jgi:integrase
MVSIQKSHLRAIRNAGLERFPFLLLAPLSSAPRCAESGMDRHTLAKLLGHSSPRITEKYYIHVTEPHISADFERFMAMRQSVSAPSKLESLDCPGLETGGLQNRRVRT